MTYAAIDLHKKESQIRILTEAGEVIDRRIRTTRPALSEVFGTWAPLRVLLEASTESEWVAQHLETLGHDVVVADPNYAPMYGTRSRRIKTDLRDTAALTEACRHGTYRAVHRRSAGQRTRQWELSVRDQLVRTRSRAAAGVRAITRSVGARLPAARGARLLMALDELELPVAARQAVAPLAALIGHTTSALEALDARLAALATVDPTCQRLMTAPSVGPITAVAFVAALDTPHRFRTASQVTQYLGLVPREASSGEQQRRGHIVRSAQPRVQALLVQAGWRVLRSTEPPALALRLWGQALAARRGRRIAAVALARRLARVLWAMWRDETRFRPAVGRSRRLEE